MNKDKANEIITNGEIIEFRRRMDTASDKRMLVNVFCLGAKNVLDL